MKKVFCFFILLSPLFLNGQIPNHQITGSFTGFKPADGDSVIFYNAFLNQGYYLEPVIKSVIRDGKFSLYSSARSSQMYYMVLSSDAGRRRWHLGRYYVSPSTSQVVVNLKDEECNNIDGAENKEFTLRFIPFMFGHEMRCDSDSFFDLGHAKNLKYDSLLYNYTLKHPDSQVALWSLIERFELYGQSSLRSKTINAFSGSIKRLETWKYLNKKILAVKIKEDQAFPILKVTDTAGLNGALKIPDSKFILTLFWFSRCKPCLEEFPELKELYNKFHLKGFEIISISTDPEKDKKLWKERIKQYSLNWPQYLDLNAANATLLGIKFFPTSYLLSSRARVIKRDLSLKELEVFLEANLN